MVARKIKKIRMMALLSFVIFAYVVRYLFLSMHGRYEPAAIGLSGVKWYDWAPKGFVTDFKWNRPLIFAYYPLFFLDTLCWHKSAVSVDNRYPFNEVAEQDIGKVYKAWKK